jgi:hypothetical protein
MGIAVIFPLSMLLYSNSRITDVRSSINDAKETLRAEMALGFNRLENKIDHLADLLATHLEEHHK